MRGFCSSAENIAVPESPQSHVRVTQAALCARPPSETGHSPRVVKPRYNREEHPQLYELTVMLGAASDPIGARTGVLTDEYATQGRPCRGGFPTDQRHWVKEGDASMLPKRHLK